MRAIVIAVAVAACLGAAFLLSSYPPTTKVDVASMAIGHCANFHSLAGLSELLRNQASGKGKEHGSVRRAALDSLLHPRQTTSA